MSETKSKVAIVTDVSSSLTSAVAREHGIYMVPVPMIFGTRQYHVGVDLDTETFYRLLRSNGRLPTTSQSTAADFVQAYTTLSKQAETIVSIHISQQMSGMLDSARAACGELPDVPIRVIDSRSVTLGLGLLALAAARAAAAGQDADEVCQLVEKLIPKMNVIFTVDTLEYLRKGGRIGGAAALLGLALSIKPVLQVKDGRIEPLEKPRTRARAVSRLLDLVAERVSPTERVHAAIFHCVALDEAQQLAEQVQARVNCADLFITEAGPIIGTHAGPGTLGVAFCTDCADLEAVE